MSTYTTEQTQRKNVFRKRFERNSEGVVECILQLVIPGYVSNEINVFHEGLSVSIDANRTEAGLSRQRRDSGYHRVLQLPPNSDLTKHIKAFHDNDTLCIRMPVIPQFFSSTTHRKSRNCLNVTPLQRDDSSVYIHNVPIGDEFVDGNFSVNVENYMAHVTIFKQYEDLDGDLSRMEVNSEHNFPLNVAIERLKAEVDGRTLKLYAPYKSGLGPLRSSRTTMSSSSSMFLERR